MAPARPYVPSPLGKYVYTASDLEEQAPRSATLLAQHHNLRRVLMRYRRRASIRTQLTLPSARARRNVSGYPAIDSTEISKQQRRVYASLWFFVVHNKAMKLLKTLTADPKAHLASIRASLAALKLARARAVEASGISSAGEAQKTTTIENTDNNGGDGIAQVTTDLATTSITTNTAMNNGDKGKGEAKEEKTVLPTAAAPMRPLPMRPLPLPEVPRWKLKVVIDKKVIQSKFESIRWDHL
ncbi:hypothetical protein B0T24DRAFT_683913 [Lasiosphaeria ovina]|uniref:Uncharacterized protein n=1 Tax=Lasiosphaeria ovina TaxID=92902 RepID=A0AAE0N054_9PEZI|nr:hypothetical protein B0T24DRAFT_683913 [Lasiosphaeria ovina]